MNEHVYLDTPELWDRLARLLRRRGECGLDSEFYNVDVRKQSCVGRARIHVFSIAVRSDRKSPLGFHRAVGWVLPVAALESATLRAALEDETIRKFVHNQPVDDHSFHNHGVKLKGCLNTLNYARWRWPELKVEGGFGLKNLMGVRLHRNIVCEFSVKKKWLSPDNWGLVNFQRLDKWTVTKTVEETVCSCGVPKCRKRKGHEKTTRTVEVVIPKEKLRWGEYTLESIVPGHPRWELLLEYAAEDAIAAMELKELMDAEPDPAPWPPWSSEPAPRPSFAQDVDDEVVFMERRGFPVDRKFCREQLAKIVVDEEAELAWLHRWYVRNSPFDGPHRREDTDKTWTSAPRLIRLLDALEIPHSPIWKKGRVKDGDVKTDETAMDWIRREVPAMSSLVSHYIRLKRIRSGKKYHTKLGDSSGHIHPICGPAGDSDDRNGAISGRLGIKGEFEAQQMPKEGEKDLYQIRRAIVANPVEV